MSPRLNKSRPFCYEETLRSKKERDKSVTLLELLIAITLLSVIVIGFSSIDRFSRYHVLTTDRRAQVQNEASFALEHTSKNIVRAIGNEKIYGENTVVNIKDDTGGGERERIKIYIDSGPVNPDGTYPPGDGIRDTVNDHWIAYRYNDNTYPTPSKRNQIEFCSRCSNKFCDTCTTGWETVSLKANQVSGLVPYKPAINPPTDNTLTDNYLGVEITARWNPTQAVSSDNPEVTMRTRIKMPSVSIN